MLFFRPTLTPDRILCLTPSFYLPATSSHPPDGDIPKQMLTAQGIPVGRPAKIELRNQHLIYAVTWLSLGVITAGLWGLVWKKGKIIKPVQGRMGR